MATRGHVSGRTRLAGAGAAALMVALLGACGGGGDSAATESTGAPPSAGAQAPSTPTTTELAVTMPTDFDDDASMAGRRSLPASLTVSPAVASLDRCRSGDYPAQVEWPGAVRQRAATAATDGTPQIRQVRNGQVVATYTRLGVAGCEQPDNNDVAPETSCGAFPRGVGRNWQEGDVFEIYPAVYEGSDQQIWIGPTAASQADRDAGRQSVPRNLTIRGVTVDGRRPVLRMAASGASDNTSGQGLIHLVESSGITIENIEVAGGPSGSVGDAGIYLDGTTDLTLRNLWVHGFSTTGANGIFGTSANAGVLRIDAVELSGNGGDSGPQHNIYINPSQTDPAFTVWMTGSYTHDAFYGNTFKSRAQVNLIEGNYFQGSLSVDGAQTEAYLLDLPEGGRALVRNNVLVKNASGLNSNGALMSYAVEGVKDGRPMSLVVEHNTFLAYARSISGTHLIFPMFTPYQTEGGDRWTFDRVSVNNNLFAGFCGTGAREGYRGDSGMVIDFTELDLNFAPIDKSHAGNPAVVGRTSYVHVTRRDIRRTAVVGALD